ncbi:MAG TPA: ribulose-phosphate 3-epimerase [Solirubrobacteraceae bacterium]|nr:ribulose-phosphate 3-epimerase [Solirubrobacteraceae bacterium]
MTNRVAPSILSADFGRLREQVSEVIAAGATIVHVDVMDGHFVPPITMGPIAVEALAGLGAEIDVHLMIERPERQVAEFARAGATAITFHAEATAHAHRAIDLIREAGCRAGVAINPGTPPARGFAEVSPDVALCMTVDPGWGGQRFIDGSLDKVRRVRELIGPGVELEVDGGIDASTAGPCAQAGATLFVAGSAIFRAPDPAAAYREIAAAAGCG